MKRSKRKCLNNRKTLQADACGLFLAGHEGVLYNMGKLMLTLLDIKSARDNISSSARQTPLDSSTTFSRLFGCRVYLKLENLQRTGSFKIRGASNKIASLSEREGERGVITASAGNHAQGVALAARDAGIAATIVMPKTASLAKVEATKNYGAKVVLEGDSYDEAAHHAHRLSEQGNLPYIPAFDDEHIIAGQGTIGLELLEQLPELEVVLVPVGGGGLIGGIALALKELKPSVQVIGVQSAAVPAVIRALEKGEPEPVSPQPTVADGIAVHEPGKLTVPLIRRYVDDVVAVDEEAITQSMVLLLERCKLVVEGAGAVGLAALLSEKVKLPGKHVALVLSGGNIDTNLIARVIQHGLGHAGRYLMLRVTLPDRPGQLARLLTIIGEAGANVLEVSHHRQGIHLSLGQTEVEITAETRDSSHAQEVLKAVREHGYHVEVGL